MRIFSFFLSLVSAICISCLPHIISSPIVRHCFASCTPEHSNGLEPLGSVCDLNVYISITYLLIDICGRTALRRSFTL